LTVIVIDSETFGSRLAPPLCTVTTGVSPISYPDLSKLVLTILRASACKENPIPTREIPSMIIKNDFFVCMISF